jgi:predicted NBD/HSP70 family sugar kinase
MLREITDSSVLGEVFHRGRVTRAGLAGATGLSGPTVWESVRRLAGAGLLRAAGRQQTSGRGRAATYYELTGTAGWVLALTVNQQGVRARAADMAGRPIGANQQPAGAHGDTGSLILSIRRAVQRAVGAAAGHGTLRAVAMSVANPVRPGTGEIIALPGSPFPAGMHLPTDILADIAGAPLLIDNDVNLAALAERHAGPASEVSSFAYVYVGAGLGLALYVGDQLIRGAHGLAGEIGYPAAVGNGQYATRRGSCPAGLRPPLPIHRRPRYPRTASRAQAGNSAAITAIRELGTPSGTPSPRPAPSPTPNWSCSAA